MFSECHNIINIDFIHCNTKNVTNLEHMFYQCNNLESINILSFNKNKINNMKCMFYGCKNLKNLDLSSFDFKRTIDKSYMLYNCKNYKNFYLSSLVSNNIDINYFLCNNMTITYKIDKQINRIQLFDYSFVKNNKDKCYLIIEGKEHELYAAWILNEKQKEKEILEIILIEKLPITNMSCIFKNCYNLISLKDIDKWDTINITDMSFMFLYCKLLKSLPDISKWNTRNVKKVNSIFSNCASLKSLPDISIWDYKNFLILILCLVVVIL